MKLSDAATAAAAEYWATLDEVEAAKPATRRHERACGVLKRHMAAESLATYRGIEMVTTPGQRVDLDLLTAKDPDLVDLCRVETARRSLVPKRRPKSRAAAAVAV